MPEYVNDSLINHIQEGKIVVFASNGSLRKDGSNVMGKGVGKAIKSMLPSIDKAMGNYIKAGGNKCYSFKVMNYIFISFPTKNNYWEEEDLELIKKSVSQLHAILNDTVKGVEKILMEYPLLSKEVNEDIELALKDLEVTIYR